MGEPTLEPRTGSPGEGQLESPTAAASLGFEGFFEHERDRVYRALCLLCGNAVDAEDLVQEAFVVVLERWDRVSLMEQPSGYLHRVAVNAFRRRQRRTNLLRRIAPFHVQSDDISRAESRSAIGQALANLPVRQRSALVLTELLAYGSDEAGQILGIAGSTVRALATQGRAAMKEAMRSSDG